jgi:rod shape-determining protein MreC
MGHSWNWKQVIAFFLIFAPALLLYALQNRALNWPGESPLKKPAHWLQRGYDGLTYEIQDTLNTYFYLVGVNTENQRLLTENAQLASRIQLLEEYRSENIRLRELFQFRQEFDRDTLPARVISKDIIIQQNSFTIDKGRADGVERLQGVIAAGGVVGYTIEVDEHSSRVLLLSNHNASIDALVQRTRARGVVSGVSTDRYLLKYMMRSQDAQVGDIVVTSGRQGFFPKGFKIGTVEDVLASPTAVSFQAKIKPSVEIDRLESVLVVIEKKVEPEVSASL